MSISSLINANTHRVKEGARVLEDIARFVLRDEQLFLDARNLRHVLKNEAPIFDALPDLGGPDFNEDNVRHNLLSIVTANTARIQEALRVLEEHSVEQIRKQNIKQLRYASYDLQKHFYQKTQEYLKHKKLSGLYLIIDTDVITMPLSQIISIVNQSTVHLIQYRSKLLDKKTFLKNAIQIRNQLNTDKLLIINDHIDVALDVGDGLHLGQDDYQLDRVRQILPDNMIFGVTCHNLTEAQNAEQYGASYISVGCLFPTTSKKDVIITKLPTLSHICSSIKLPVCAIGGINLDNYRVVQGKVNMIAMLSAIWLSDDPLVTISEICSRSSFTSPLVGEVDARFLRGG